MRTCIVFALFWLAVGITPSFALPIRKEKPFIEYFFSEPLTPDRILSEAQKYPVYPRGRERSVSSLAEHCMKASPEERKRIKDILDMHPPLCGARERTNSPQH
ncbi:hypothetical protein F5148DRAFT_1253337 [Russula earlei]|uniref:Uncharacterized protein n=1 Tax=Russula earlei TaxID=71964 RepID=A0ACC0TT04_9AGAM|nr:hypothetical protein F5148DRAFT_1253337 [Russula earlei]